MNIATIVGYVGNTPQMNYTVSGLAVTKFSVATNEKTKDGERTEWHNIVAFGKLAEVCREYLKKGSLVAVAGKLQTSSWEKDGHKFYRTEIVISHMRMFGSKFAATQPENQSSSNGDLDDIPF